MQQKDGFILFPLDEFRQWLLQNKFRRPVKLIQNHHTEIPNYGYFKNENHFTLLHGMKKSHMEERGFSDIAQNFTTFPDGTLAVCRSLENDPAGIKGANKNGICIEHLGNFNNGKDQMKDEQRKTIIELNAVLCEKYHLTPNTNTIVYHHWYNRESGLRTNGGTDPDVYKTCPGSNFFGGNSVEAANANFIPLVIQALNSSLATHAAKILKSGVVTAASLNVRKGPNILAPVLNQLPKETAVQVYEEKSNWYRISPSADAWVSARFIS